MKFSRLLTVIGLTLCLLGVSSAYVRAYTVAGPSMSPTLLVGDFIVSNHAAYDLRLPYLDTVLLKTAEPQAGDLIMYFDIPKNVMATKRIIGVAGDTVSMDNNMLYINGIAATQSDVQRTLFDAVAEQNGLGELVVKETLGSREYLITYTPEKSPVHSFEEVTVTEDTYFILGDHRDNSADSRYIGLISREQIKGRVFHGARTLGSYAQ
ncbi:MAG: signal peptidase I [Alkalimonas sp.]|nr:signal peptidase I [Alkalimonas sp.]